MIDSMRPWMRRQMLVFVLALLPVALVTASADDARQRGTLDIQFEVHTRPGGETVQQGPAVISPFNIGLAVRADGVKVNEDGTFSFEARGTYRLDYHATSPGMTIDANEHRADRVLGKGQVQPDGTLALDLAWGHGEGLLVVVTSVGGSTARQPATEAVPLPTWNLSPVSREGDDADSRRVTIQYKSRRPSTVVGTYTVPLTERIEVKYDTKLVPRG